MEIEPEILEKISEPNKSVKKSARKSAAKSVTKNMEIEPETLEKISEPIKSVKKSARKSAAKSTTKKTPAQKEASPLQPELIPEELPETKTDLKPVPEQEQVPVDTTHIDTGLIQNTEEEEAKLPKALEEAKEIEENADMDIENQNQTSIENEIVKDTLERLPTVRTGETEAEPIEEIPNKFGLAHLSTEEPIDEGFTNDKASLTRSSTKSIPKADFNAKRSILKKSVEKEQPAEINEIVPRQTRSRSGSKTSLTSKKGEALQEKEAPLKANLDEITEEPEDKNVPQVEERVEDKTEQYEPEITKKLKTDIDVNESIDEENERQEGEQSEKKENVGEQIQEDLNTNSNISNFLNLN